MKQFLGVMLVLFSMTTKADVILLVHGFLGGAWSWERSQIVKVLAANQWVRGGMIQARSPSQFSLSLSHIESKNKVISVVLRSYARISEQAEMLKKTIDVLTRFYPNEPIHLIGHSAGGVVARMLVVKNYHPQIKTLITISSPHLGTQRAELASNMTDLPYPMDLMAKMVGGEIYDNYERTQLFFQDLVRAKPNTFLYNLNLLAHPRIRYVSIIHQKKSAIKRDFIVPEYSQDMNNIPAINGRSERFYLKSQHFLSYYDGLALVEILNRRSK